MGKLRVGGDGCGMLLLKRRKEGKGREGRSEAAARHQQGTLK